MSGRGITKLGQDQFLRVGIPFMGFMVLGSYGLSTWVEGRIRMKSEKRQQVRTHGCGCILSPRSLCVPATRRAAASVNNSSAVDVDGHGLCAALWRQQQ